LQFVIPGSSQQVRVKAQVVWSRISTKPDKSGRHGYLSGLRVDDEEGSLKDAIERMLAAAIVRRDTQSLEKKKKALVAKDKSRQQPGVKIVGRGAPRIPDDVILLIRQTRQRLQANPTEAVKWYNRAKYSLNEAGVQIHHRDEILAIWEYLERSIELNIIARVVDELGK
jgi:Tfp pilus assembly protein PilZ